MEKDSFDPFFESNSLVQPMKKWVPPAGFVPTKKKKGIRYRETEIAHIWTIANIKFFYPGGVICSSGKTVLARSFKDKPHKITFQTLNYVSAEKPKKNPEVGEKSQYCFSIKNGVLNIYSRNKDFTTGKFRVRNVSNRFIFNDFGLKHVEHVKRVCRILNSFFIRNKYKGRLVGLNSAKFKDEAQKKTENPTSVDIFQLYQNEFNRQIRLMLYPGLAEWTTKHPLPLIMSSFSRHLRHGGVKHLIKKCYGFDSKKLTKRIIEDFNKSPNLVKICHRGLVCKGVLKLDDYHNYYDLIPFAAEQTMSGERIKKMRAFLKKFSRERILRWLKHPQSYGFVWRDTAKMMEDNPNIVIPSSIKDLNEIHDYLAREINKLKNPNVIIEYDEKTKEIDGVDLDGLVIKLAPDTWTLVDWGRLQNNCIASYASRAVEKSVKILGIFKGNELKYNIEIRGKSLGQFKGKNNCNPDEEDQKKIIEYLVKEDIIKERPEYGLYHVDNIGRHAYQEVDF